MIMNSEKVRNPRCRPQNACNTHSHSYSINIIPVEFSLSVLCSGCITECLTVIKIDWYLWDFMPVVVLIFLPSLYVVFFGWFFCRYSYSFYEFVRSIEIHCISLLQSTWKIVAVGNNFNYTQSHLIESGKQRIYVIEINVERMRERVEGCRIISWLHCTLSWLSLSILCD